MTEPQKVSTCRYCGQEITWTKDAVTGKNYPKNLNGSAHLCKSQPAPAQAGNTEKCTSPGTPAATLKTVEGQITFLDISAHKIIIKDRHGETTTFIWAPPMHDQMAKLKQWWFSRLTGEHEPEFGMYRLTAQEFFKRPEDWPAPQHGGGKPFTPRNERIIVLQSCMKVAADVWISSGRKITPGRNLPPGEINYEDAMTAITTEAIRAAEALCTAGKVA